VLTLVKEQQASWVRNFNPLLAPDLVRFPTTCGIYEPMLIYNGMRGEYVPWLATAHHWSDDNRTLSFDVRDGVRWSDGEAMTARDVQFTFELMRKHKALDLNGVWRFIREVRATDDGRVVFHFSRPYVPGLIYLAHQPIVPQHIWRDVADPVAFANPNPVATGPFTEVRSFKNQVYELAANPHYWQPGKPAVEVLRFPAYPSNDQVNLALIHGELDWAGSFVPAIDRIFVGRNPKHHGYWFPLVGGTVMLYPNLTRAPFGDIRVRKAISMAIDRARIVQVAMYGYTRPADVTALHDGYRQWRDEATVERHKWTDFDRVRAEQLLDEAGFRKSEGGIRRGQDGKPLKLEISTVSGWSDWVRAAQIVSRSLRSIGIEVSMVTYDFSAWFDKLQRADFDLSLGWTVEGATPYAFYRNLMSSETRKPAGEASPTNWHRYSSDRADSLLKQFERTTDPAKQQHLVTEMQALFAREVPAIPLFLSPSWGEYNTTRFTGFPTKSDPYAKLSPNHLPESLLVLMRLEPRRSSP
jgi:peptide/nickel transport system substrate-binding protein